LGFFVLLQIITKNVIIFNSGENMNKYYEKFINEEIDETLLKVNHNSLSFEDHFWHFACLSLYYKNKNDFYMFKKSLSAACDLNYIYNALLYFEAFNVLPNNFKKYIKNFEHQMKDDKIESLIGYANKKDKKKNGLNFLWYSLGSILIIPLMLLFVFVFKMDTTVAAVAAIIFIFLSQTILTPMQKRNKEMKIIKRNNDLSKEEKNFFNFLLPFNNLLYEEKYLAMIRAETDEERDLIVKAIKTNKPLPDEIKNKGKKIKKEKAEKNKK